MMARKMRKLDSGKYLPSGLPEAAGTEVAENNPITVGEKHPPGEPQVLAVEARAPTNEEVPLVLVAKPKAPTWARHIAHFLQTGELPKSKKKWKE